MATRGGLARIRFAQITHQTKGAVFETFFVAALKERHEFGIDCIEELVRAAHKAESSDLSWTWMASPHIRPSSCSGDAVQLQDGRHDRLQEFGVVHRAAHSKAVSLRNCRHKSRQLNTQGAAAALCKASSYRAAKSVQFR